jgi:hypothetical protein
MVAGPSSSVMLAAVPVLGQRLVKDGAGMHTTPPGFDVHPFSQVTG